MGIMKLSPEEYKSQRAEWSKADRQVRAEIDKEVLWGMLKNLGWTRVLLDRLQDNKHAIDITYWLEENCRGAYERDGRDFLFENPKDASMFILKWV
jgi:hypothetical protein